MYEIQEAYSCLENEERRKKYDAACSGNTQSTRSNEKNARSGGEPFRGEKPDMSQFQRFFGFQPGKGMETYQGQETKKLQGLIKPEEMFAAFFGVGSMQEAGKNASGNKGKRS